MDKKKVDFIKKFIPKRKSEELDFENGIAMKYIRGEANLPVAYFHPSFGHVPNGNKKTQIEGILFVGWKGTKCFKSFREFQHPHVGENGYICFGNLPEPESWDEVVGNFFALLEAPPHYEDRASTGYYEPKSWVPEGMTEEDLEENAIPIFPYFEKIEGEVYFVVKIIDKRDSFLVEIEYNGDLDDFIKELESRSIYHLNEKFYYLPKEGGTNES